MEMTPNEILRDYNSAKNKRTQIQILADLNLCDPSDIAAILIEGGADKRTIPKEYKPDYCPPPVTSPSFRKPTPPPPPKFAPADPSATLKPRALHDWDRLVDIAEAVRDAIAKGKAPETEWLQEMCDTFNRYYTEPKGEKR